MESLSASQTLKLGTIVRRSPLLGTVLDRWADIRLPNCWLVAGAIAQTVWNDAFHLPSSYGISDVDLVYFDPSDLSEQAETQQSIRIRALFSDLPTWIDVKNEARVHLWYERKCGRSIPPYASTEDAIGTFPTTATALGVQEEAGQLRLFAPYGLTDLLGLIVRANKKQIARPVYEAKIARWQVLWPKLQVVPWDAEPY